MKKRGIMRYVYIVVMIISIGMFIPRKKDKRRPKSLRDEMYE